MTKIIIQYNIHKGETDITGRDLSRREIKFKWFDLSFDNNYNMYRLRGYKEMNAYGFDESAFISLDINAEIVESIKIVDMD